MRRDEVASGDGGGDDRSGPGHGLILAVSVELEHDPDLGERGRVGRNTPDALVCVHQGRCGRKCWL